MDGVDDPVDAGVDADGLVSGVDEDDLEVLEGRILAIIRVREVSEQRTRIQCQFQIPYPCHT